LVCARAMLTDKMVANPTATPTPEPPISIYGSGTVLPSLSGLIPVPTNITSAGVTAPGGAQFASLEEGDGRYGVIDRLDNKSFATFLNDQLIGPASSANLQPLVAPDLSDHFANRGSGLPGTFCGARRSSWNISALSSALFAHSNDPATSWGFKEIGYGRDAEDHALTLVLRVLSCSQPYSACSPQWVLAEGPGNIECTESNQCRWR
jgi:hypothetical protein